MSKITQTAVQRTKDRLGLSKRLAEKTAQKALDSGIKHAEAKGSLKRYFDYLYLSHGNGNNIRVYNHNVYIFHEKTLITILPLPRKYHAVADKLQKRRSYPDDFDPAG